MESSRQGGKSFSLLDSQVPLESKKKSYPGVHPQLLIKQIRNTAPFIFQYDKNFKSRKAVPQNLDHQQLPYLQTILELEKVSSFDSHPLDRVDYFTLCLSAHWTTAATFIPTDVDLTIRYKLWQAPLAVQDMLNMAIKVLESRTWNYTPVSSRFLLSPFNKHLLSTHEGTWLSVAAAAYGALRKGERSSSEQILQSICQELERESLILAEFLQSKDGLGLLKCSALIAHNLGDLDRVIDAWKLPINDPLRNLAYRCGHADPEDKRKNRRYQGLFLMAGELNKRFMATENHRHLSLRSPRVLRSHSDFLFPLGPFYDDWGRMMGKHPLIDSQGLEEIVIALVEGWKRLPHTFGPSRALNGIFETVPGGFHQLIHALPANTKRYLKSGKLKTMLSLEKDRFENLWNSHPWKFLTHQKTPKGPLTLASLF